MIEVLIPTCDKYIKYTEALMISARELWPDYENQPFRILAFKPPKFKLDPNWSFTRIGKRDEGEQSWGTGLHWFFSNYPNETFIYGSDDCALTYADEERLKIGIKFCSMRNVGRFALMADKPEKSSLVHLEGKNVIPIYEYGKGINYRLSLSWSVYNTAFFRKFLQKNMTPWQFEKQSCGDLNIEPYNILSFYPYGAIDAAYFCRKDKGVIEDWHKGYYGNNLQGQLKEKVQQIIFSND